MTRREMPMPPCHYGYLPTTREEVFRFPRPASAIDTQSFTRRAAGDDATLATISFYRPTRHRRRFIMAQLSSRLMPYRN